VYGLALSRTGYECDCIMDISRSGEANEDMGWLNLCQDRGMCISVACI
jgi:hypothetical protein